MSPIDRYRRPADLTPRIPIFPLRGAILLPRATLPLNVFEPRYLEMLDDVMSGDRLIGIIQPAAGASTDDEESPLADSVGLRRVGCVGRVTNYQEVDHARLVITLTGITRYEILDEAVTDLPYRVASVSYDRFASDLNEGLGEDQVDRSNLLRVLRSYLDATSWRPTGRRFSALRASSSSTRCASCAPMGRKRSKRCSRPTI